MLTQLDAFALDILLVIQPDKDENSYFVQLFLLTTGYSK
ncbi:hypothetical protein FHS10_001976 [Mucilaginibacter dorajii]|nr:hypothetical protein [Mucilaginibacter dorajii]